MTTLREQFEADMEEFNAVNPGTMREALDIIDKMKYTIKYLECCGTCRMWQSNVGYCPYDDSMRFDRCSKWNSPIHPTDKGGTSK